MPANLNPGPPRYITVPEIAKRMHLSRMTVYRMIHAEVLPAVRFGRVFRVEEAVVQEYIARAGAWSDTG